MKRRVWIPLLVLSLLVFSKAFVVGAAPPKVPSLGITVTPTMSAATPTPTPTSPTRCDPILRKQVSPGVVAPGDEVLFTITAVNVGRGAAVDARVLDRVPDYLEILEVSVTPQDQGQEVLPRSGQAVVVDVGTLGQDFVVEIQIRARVREDALVRQDSNGQVCVENVAEFWAPNCPSRRAEVLCWQLGESGGQHSSWLLLSGVAMSVLALGLVLISAKRKRMQLS